MVAARPRLPVMDPDNPYSDDDYEGDGQFYDEAMVAVGGSPAPAGHRVQLPVEGGRAGGDDHRMDVSGKDDVNDEGSEDDDDDEDDDGDDGDSDVEREVLVEKRKLDRRELLVNDATQKYMCPFCNTKKRGDYWYNELKKHAEDVARSGKHKVKQRLHKLLLERLKQQDLVPQQGDSMTARPGKAPEKPIVAPVPEEKPILWPPVAIVCGLPTQQEWDERQKKLLWVSKFKLDKGAFPSFNVEKAKPFWDMRGQTGEVLLYFRPDRDGLDDAEKFQQRFQHEGRGREEAIRQGRTYPWRPPSKRQSSGCRDRSREWQGSGQWGGRGGDGRDGRREREEQQQGRGLDWSGKGGGWDGSRWGGSNERQGGDTEADRRMEAQGTGQSYGPPPTGQENWVGGQSDMAPPGFGRDGGQESGVSSGGEGSSIMEGQGHAVRPPATPEAGMQDSVDRRQDGGEEEEVKVELFAWVATADELQDVCRTISPALQRELQRNHKLTKTRADLKEEERRKQEEQQRSMSKERSIYQRLIEEEQARATAAEEKAREIMERLEQADRAKKDMWHRFSTELEKRRRELERLKATSEKEFHQRAVQEEMLKQQLDARESMRLRQERQTQRLRNQYEAEKQALEESFKKKLLLLTEKQQQEMEQQEKRDEKAQKIVQEDLEKKNPESLEETRKKLVETLKEKEEEAEGLYDMVNELTKKEKHATDQLVACKDALKEYFKEGNEAFQVKKVVSADDLRTNSKNNSNGKSIADVRVKRMGVLNQQLWLNSFRERFKGDPSDVEYEFSLFFTQWEKDVNGGGESDPDSKEVVETFRPIKTALNPITDKVEWVFIESDPKVVELKERLGDEVVKDLRRVLFEIEEYNPSGRYPTPVLWNFAKEEDREATPAEAVNYLRNVISTLVNKCNMTRAELVELKRAVGPAAKLRTILGKSMVDEVCRELESISKETELPENPTQLVKATVLLGQLLQRLTDKQAAAARGKQQQQQEHSTGSGAVAGRGKRPRRGQSQT